MSPKNQRELTECSSSLSQKLKTIGKIFTIMWVASSCRAVKAVWDSYSALSTHFSQAQEDTTRDSKERAEYQGLYKLLTSTQFVMNMGTMYDALRELSELSLELQKREMTLPDANSAISRKIKVLKSVCSIPGEHVKCSSKAVRRNFRQLNYKITLK
jgi:hypothetical protein